MSAAAPALQPANRRIVVVRLADVSWTMAWFSGTFALLLFFFPVWFPQQVVQAWQSGRLATFMVVFTLLLDGVLYFRIAHRLSASPGVVHAVWLGSMPVLVSLSSTLLLQSAISNTLLRDLPHSSARITEEILAYTYFGIVSAILVPFLIIRLTQQFKANKKNESN